MTDDQAKYIQAIVLAGTVQRERDESELDFLRRYLLPLPYEYVLRRVEEYVAQVGRDRDGKSTHAWISTPGELLEACGLPDKAGVRADVVRAFREGGEYLPDLRSMDGWSYVPPGAPKPQGVVEAEIVALESAKPAPALPPPMPRRLELVGAIDRQIASLARSKRDVEPGGRKQPPPDQIEAELAAVEARFKEAL